MSIEPGLSNELTMTVRDTDTARFSGVRRIPMC